MWMSLYTHVSIGKSAYSTTKEKSMTMSIEGTTNPAQDTTDNGPEPEFDEQAAAGLSDEEYLAGGAAVDQRPGNA
jgi:hypothetical protein